MRAALERSAVPDADVGYVVMGQVIQAGAGQIPSRQAQIAAGLPREIGSETMNKVCASGMRAVTLADQMIRAGDQQVVVAGGMESMSQAPYLLPKARFGYRMGERRPGRRDAPRRARLDVRRSAHDRAGVARRPGSSASAVRIRTPGRFARTSGRVAATDTGLFAEEIVPVEGVEVDEAPRRDTSLEKLAKLPPVGDPEGTTTVGNAPGLNDGAAALVVASEDYAQGAAPRAAGSDHRVGVRRRRLRLSWPGPPGLPASVRWTGWASGSGEVERIEINEAFCLGGPPLDAHARGRSRARERERWCRSARASDRRLGSKARDDS